MKKSRPKIQTKRPILHYAHRIIHSLLGAIASWLVTGVVVVILGVIIGDPLSTTVTTLSIALPIVLLGWLLIGLPIAISFSKHTVRRYSDVVARYIIATTASFTGIILILLFFLAKQAPEFIFVTIIFFFPLLLWAAAIGFVGGTVFWALQQRFAR